MNALKLYALFLRRLVGFFNTHKVESVRNTLSDLSAATNMSFNQISVARKFAEQNDMPFPPLLTKEEVLRRVKDLDVLAEQLG